MRKLMTFKYNQSKLAQIKHLQPLLLKQLCIIRLFFQATITAMHINPKSGRIIGSGWIPLSFVSAVVAFEVLLTNVECVESDGTVALLKNYKGKSKQIYLSWMNVSNAGFILWNIFITLSASLKPIPYSFRLRFSF